VEGESVNREVWDGGGYVNDVDGEERKGEEENLGREGCGRII
jgi:hypothetical protein